MIIVYIYQRYVYICWYLLLFSFFLSFSLYSILSWWFGSNLIFFFKNRCWDGSSFRHYWVLTIRYDNWNFWIKTSMFLFCFYCSFLFYLEWLRDSSRCWHLFFVFSQLIDILGGSTYLGKHIIISHIHYLWQVFTFYVNIYFQS